MSRFEDEIRKMPLTTNSNGAVVMAKTSKHKPLTETQRKILIKDRYVILASGAKYHGLRLYYDHRGTLGTVSYSVLELGMAQVSVHDTHFRFRQIVHLRNYLYALPFGRQLVENMEHVVIPVGDFKNEMERFTRSKNMR